MITFIELGFHDMTIDQPTKYSCSYGLSVLFSSLLIIELIRAYAVVKRCIPKEEIEKEYLANNEIKRMHTFWTKKLSDEEIEKGNAYLIWDRARWSIFQLIIAGL